MKLTTALAIIIAMLSFIPVNASEIYKCPTEKGRLVFQDTPCPDNAKGQQFSVEKPSRKKKQSVSLESMMGYWCEKGFSQTLDGKLDTSRPAIWHFKNEKEMSYSYPPKKKYARKTKEVFNGYTINGQEIVVENKYIGTWRIIEQKIDSMILQSSFDTYSHLYKGKCEK